MLTCLWLARMIPFPLISGDRKYSAKLAEAFAATGVAITYLGFGGGSPPQHIDNVDWYTVPGKPHGRVVSVLSMMPLVGARHSTSQYKNELRRQLHSKAWDIIVIDQYAMGWVPAYQRLFRRESCRLVFITHDHEESVTRQQRQDTRNGLWEYLYLWQNYLKTRYSERRTAQACDLVTVNTESDAELFRRTAPGAAIVTVTPAYDGPRVAHQPITAETPRAAVMFGSYRWSVKQVNLRLFLDFADTRMHQAGIEMRIVGDIPADLRATLERQYVSARFTGFVQDPAPHLRTRLAIVAEPIAGGCATICPDGARSSNLDGLCGGRHRRCRPARCVAAGRFRRSGKCLRLGRAR